MDQMTKVKNLIVKNLIAVGMSDDDAHDAVEAPDGSHPYDESHSRHCPGCTLTVDDIEAGYADDRWGGFGYLNERQHAMATAAGRRDAAKADARILAYANAQGWTPEDLFQWTNSTYGRHFGDSFRGGESVVPTEAQEALMERDAKALLRKVVA